MSKEHVEIHIRSNTVQRYALLSERIKLPKRHQPDDKVNLYSQTKQVRSGDKMDRKTQLEKEGDSPDFIMIEWLLVLGGA